MSDLPSYQSTFKCPDCGSVVNVKKNGTLGTHKRKPVSRIRKALLSISIDPMYGEPMERCPGRGKQVTRPINVAAPIHADYRDRARHAYQRAQDEEAAAWRAGHERRRQDERELRKDASDALRGILGAYIPPDDWELEEFPVEYYDNGSSPKNGGFRVKAILDGLTITMSQYRRVLWLWTDYGGERLTRESFGRELVLR